MPVNDEKRLRKAHLWAAIKPLRRRAEVIEAGYTLDVSAMKIPGDEHYNSIGKLRNAKLLLILDKDEEYKDIRFKLDALEYEHDQLYDYFMFGGGDDSDFEDGEEDSE